MSAEAEPESAVEQTATEDASAVPGEVIPETAHDPDEESPETTKPGGI